MAIRFVTLSAVVAAVLGAAPAGQSNGDPDINVQLVDLQDLTAHGRTGTFPNGRNGLAAQTTICNTGLEEIVWLEPMAPQHPIFASLLVRQSGARIEQISDRSYVKHGFGAANQTFCGPCSPPVGPSSEALGLGCSDTYSENANGNRLYLGPPDEVDPWTGIWNPICSHFDRSEPPVPSPDDCDGVRSLGPAQVGGFNAVTHRVEVDDADLNVPNVNFYLQCHVVVPGELEAARADSLGSRRMLTGWNGSNWVFLEQGSLLAGSVLQRWEGATVTSATNGADDGRVYIASRVTGPVAGMYHYEYALHNRDNLRGVRALAIPSCQGARITNATFRDVDSDGANDWNIDVNATEIVFSTNVNPLRWNTIFNFSFDSDAAPSEEPITLDAFDSGAGASSFTVSNASPAKLYNPYLGAGCASGTPPDLYAAGSPARATLGNSSFAIESSGNVPGRVSLLLAGTGGSVRARAGCLLWAGDSARAISARTANGAGLVRHPTPIPNDPMLEGATFDLQCLIRTPSASPKLRRIEFSDGLRVRIGNSTPSCP